MTTHHTDEKKPAHGGLSALTLSELERIAEEISTNARHAFKSAMNAPEGSDERTFIEHGAMCYANCFFMLQEVLRGVSSLPLVAQSELQSTHRQL